MSGNTITSDAGYIGELGADVCLSDGNEWRGYKLNINVVESDVNQASSLWEMHTHN